MQKSRIFDAETSILSTFQFISWPIYHENSLERQGFRALFGEKYDFLENIDFSERCTRGDLGATFGDYLGDGNCINCIRNSLKRWFDGLFSVWAFFFCNCINCISFFVCSSMAWKLAVCWSRFFCGSKKSCQQAHRLVSTNRLGTLLGVLGADLFADFFAWKVKKFCWQKWGKLKKFLRFENFFLGEFLVWTKKRACPLSPRQSLVSVLYDPKGCQNL